MKPLRPISSRLSSFTSVPRTWSHMPNQARFGASTALKKSQVPSGFVLFSRKPWVRKRGVLPSDAFEIRSRSSQYCESWFESCWSAQLSASQPGRSVVLTLPMK